MDTCTSLAATGPASTTSTTASTANTYAGDQANPCGDPPGAAGTALSPPGAEGGALRSQSVRRTDGPATLDGAVLRIDPATGAGVRGNPFFPHPMPTRAASWPTGCVTRSESRNAQGPTSCGSAMSAGTTGRRSTGSSYRPAPRRRTSAGRATREPHRKAATRAPASTCAHRCTRRLVRSSRRTTRTTTARAW